MESKSNDTGEINTQLCNILKINNRIICLLCMENLSYANNDLTTEDKSEVSHLQSVAHNMNVKSLFRECLFDSSVDNQVVTQYSYILDNFIFDTSLYLGNESSYVTICGYDVFCLICSKKLFKANIDVSLVDTILFDHLQSELHKENMKTWICWVYFFNNKNNYIMISHSAVYCSFCKKTVGSTVNGLLPDVVNHLENKHDHHIQRIAGSVSDHVENVHVLCQQQIPEMEKENDYLEGENNHYPQRNINYTEITGHMENKDIYLQSSAKDVKNTLLENEDIHDLQEQYDKAEKRDHVEEMDAHYLEKSLAINRRANDLQENDNVHLFQKCFDEDVKIYFNREKENVHLEKRPNEYIHHLQRTSDETKKKAHLENEVIDHFKRSFNEDVNTVIVRKHDNLENECCPHPQENYEGKQSNEDLGSSQDLNPQRSDKDIVVNASYIQDCVTSLNIHCDNSDSEEHNLTEFDSNESSECDDNDGTLEALTCPDCGDFIEIINENAEFSLQFHLQKHRDLKSINFDGQLEFDSNADYVCPICQEIIPIFNKNIELSVTHHFEVRKVDHEGFGFPKDDEARCDVLDQYFNRFPESLKKYESFLIIEHNSIICKLCNYTLLIKNIDDTSKILHEHLCSSYHVGQFKCLSQDLAMVVVDYNRQNESEQQQTDLFETLVRKYASIKRNRQYIEKRKTNYFCQLCQKHICYSPNETTLSLNFRLHLKGKLHRDMLNNRGEGLSSVTSKKRSKQERGVGKPGEKNKVITRKTLKSKIVKFSRVSFSVNINLKYIEIKNESFFCSVCMLQIMYTENGSHLISHYNSSTHNEILRRNALVYVSKLQNVKRAQVNRKNIFRLKTAFKELTHLEYMKPHLAFIHFDKQDYRCVICDVLISASKKGLRSHLSDDLHKNNAFLANKEVTCSQ